jgi:hypothetical protein
LTLQQRVSLSHHANDGDGEKSSVTYPSGSSAVSLYQS